MHSTVVQALSVFTHVLNMSTRLKSKAKDYNGYFSSLQYWIRLSRNFSHSKPIFDSFFFGDAWKKNFVHIHMHVLIGNKTDSLTWSNFHLTVLIRHMPSRWNVLTSYRGTHAGSDRSRHWNSKQVHQIRARNLWRTTKTSISSKVIRIYCDSLNCTFWHVPQNHSSISAT